MNSNRTIPILLTDKGKLLKGKKFKNHVYCGDPINAARVFSEFNCSEIAYFSRSGLDSKTLQILDKIVRHTMCSFAYGGGLCSIDDVNTVFKLGVEKCIFNSIAYQDLDLIKNAVLRYGSQAICVSVDYKTFNGEIYLYSKNGTKLEGIKLNEHLSKLVDLGVGEVILSNIDKDGTRSGIDLNILKNINPVPIPIIISGGLSSRSELKDIIENNQVSLGVGHLFMFMNNDFKSNLLSYFNPNFKSIFSKYLQTLNSYLNE